MADVTYIGREGLLLLGVGLYPPLNGGGFFIRRIYPLFRVPTDQNHAARYLDQRMVLPARVHAPCLL